MLRTIDIHRLQHCVTRLESRLRNRTKRLRSQWVVHRDHSMQTEWRRNRQEELAAGGERTPNEYGKSGFIATSIQFHTRRINKTASVPD
ncbi:hypothetical protein RISK_005758 [Rhodopirellula islandica]|uniref:Uncharacterized protein n=1 Tax=Rhodopirellula islandica TaxID=595434 RepID=A0A0J1B7I7_RHOIS|nr:hypothetical protein RISK_005758 [Rhodopirellula islandica]